MIVAGLRLCREYRVLRWWMISIGSIALSNAYDSTLVAVIIQVEHLGCRSSRRRSSHNTQTRCVPDKVLSPPLLTRIENGDDFTRCWITPFEAIATTFVAVAAG